MLLLPPRREENRGRGALDLKLPHQIQMIAAFQAYWDKILG
jgi:hypothetical protein